MYLNRNRPFVTWKDVANSGVLRQGRLGKETRHPGRSCGLGTGYYWEVEGVDRGG